MEFKSRGISKSLRTGANRNDLIFSKKEFSVRNYNGKSCVFHVYRLGTDSQIVALLVKP